MIELVEKLNHLIKQRRGSTIFVDADYVSAIVKLIEEQQIKIADIEEQVQMLRNALELIAATKRPDGTYNRSREACEVLARETLGNPNTNF